MNRAQKAELVASLNQVFAEASIVVVTHYSGLSVAEMTDLRRQMLVPEQALKVTKNRITRLALDGTPYQNIADLFTGPTAIAYSSDPVAAAKVAVEYAKKNEKLVIQGGALGEQILDLDGIKSLATLPSLDELRAKIVGMVNTPATRIAGVLQAPGGQIARVLHAKSQLGEAA